MMRIDVSGSSIESVRCDGRHLPASLLCGSTSALPAAKVRTARFDLDFLLALAAESPCASCHALRACHWICYGMSRWICLIPRTTAATDFAIWNTRTLGCTWWFSLSLSFSTRNAGPRNTFVGCTKFTLLLFYLWFLIDIMTNNIHMIAVDVIRTGFQGKERCNKSENPTWIFQAARKGLCAVASKPSTSPVSAPTLLPLSGVRWPSRGGVRWPCAPCAYIG
jgi:hypothetical protein